MIYCGIDWAEKTHDVALVDDTGQLVAKRHITDDASGYKILLDLLAEHGDSEENPIRVAIETSLGLLVAVLRTGTRKVFAINPMAAARYRDRHAVSRKKSDPGDALVLANILRTDMHAHRPLPEDSDLARAIAVLARAQQDATWNRQQIANQLRSLLREFYPAALDAVATWAHGLCRPEARELLKSAPTPAKAARLTRAQIQAALRRPAASAASKPRPTGCETSSAATTPISLPLVLLARSPSSAGRSTHAGPPARPSRPASREAQLARVVSLIPRSSATSGTGSPVSVMIGTAPSRKGVSGVSCRGAGGGPGCPRLPGPLRGQHAAGDEGGHAVEGGAHDELQVLGVARDDLAAFLGIREDLGATNQDRVLCGRGSLMSAFTHSPHLVTDGSNTTRASEQVLVRCTQFPYTGPTLLPKAPPGRTACPPVKACR
ncbi:hypothetical protein GCM10010256_84790 [Streptomyces coeruleorubidus]|nr:hypothetical protein GCM10010256_84790 [Streptomyces coeruleorubidus]